MTQRIILSTGNPDKARELRDLLGAAEVVTKDEGAVGGARSDAGAAGIAQNGAWGEASFSVITKDEAGYADVEVEETGATLEENARLKVVGLYRAMLERGEDPDAVWILADDTGLFVDALDGRPGIYAARYAGPGATYADNVAKLVGEMQGVSWENRGARFRTVIALCRGGVTETVEGFVDGRILEAPRGANGFGYDPLFYIPEEGKTLAEMDEAEKNGVSHRGRAYRNLLGKLRAEVDGAIASDVCVEASDASRARADASETERR
ncbi:MAG: RdgB/HAM1 family non-canonical purine NTP pyrophosphatase [Peptoniphilaceae bacterium]|nr:RdgB/HAM1 family non-canonical purine NTP pyrophosphatase [Peptoniphilaceae bacterium]MDY6085826.1 RdgB/HAM1 family non-canonical purine NTP pyrophosphatase [Peptoniphilaceae bacterium]